MKTTLNLPQESVEAHLRARCALRRRRRRGAGAGWLGARRRGLDAARVAGRVRALRRSAHRAAVLSAAVRARLLLLLPPGEDEGGRAGSGLPAVRGAADSHPEKGRWRGLGWRHAGGGGGRGGTAACSTRSHTVIAGCGPRQSALFSSHRPRRRRGCSAGWSEWGGAGHWQRAGRVAGGRRCRIDTQRCRGG